MSYLWKTRTTTRSDIEHLNTEEFIPDNKTLSVTTFKINQKLFLTWTLPPYTFTELNAQASAQILFSTVIQVPLETFWLNGIKAMLKMYYTHADFLL